MCVCVESGTVSVWRVGLWVCGDCECVGSGAVSVWRVRL